MRCSPGRSDSWLMTILAVAFLLLMAGLNCWFCYATKDSVDVTVITTERITTGSGETLSSKYLVFCEEETFENRDSLWYGKWNSSDIHGHLTPGRYRATVYGWRSPFWSWYRNIVAVEPL